MTKPIFPLIPLFERDNTSYTLRRYYIATEEQQRIFLTPQYAGHYIAKSGFAINGRILGNSLLLFTISGGGKLTYKNTEITLKAGSVAVLDGETPHSYYAEGDGWEFKFIHFDGAMSDEYVAYLQKNFGPVVVPSAKNLLSAIGHLDAVLALMKKTPLFVEAQLSGHIYALLMDLISTPTHDEVACSQSTLDAISESLSYIKSHYNEPISVELLAKRCFFSRPYFSKMFRKITGTTPHEYLLLYRMMNAARMISETDKDISLISSAVGFSDASTFTRAFERYYKTSPSKFRMDTKGMLTQESALPKNN